MARRGRIERWLSDAGDRVRYAQQKREEQATAAAEAAELNSRLPEEVGDSFHSASDVVPVNPKVVLSPQEVPALQNDPADAVGVHINSRRPVMVIEGLTHEPVPLEEAATAVEQAILRGLQTLEQDPVAARPQFDEAAALESAGTVLPSLLAGATALAASDFHGAFDHLRHVVGSPIRIMRRDDPDDPAGAKPDLAVRRLWINGGFTFPLQTEARLVVPLSSIGAGFLLVHVLVSLDRREDAMALLEDMVEASRNPRFSPLLAAAHADAGRWGEVLELVGTSEVVDQWTLYPGLLKARALGEQDLPDAALSAYSDVLRVARSSDLRRTTVVKEARYRRGLLNRSLGRRAAARKDFAAVIRDDPAYRDAAELSRESVSKQGADRRDPIPPEVKDQVWRRDEGRCVSCGTQENLEFDHIIPLAMGGSNTARNLQLLCEGCNRAKAANLWPGDALCPVLASPLSASCDLLPVHGV